MDGDDDDTLRAELEAALRFDHLLGMQTKLDVQEASATVFALLEELVARGLVDLRAVERAAPPRRRCALVAMSGAIARQH